MITENGYGRKKVRDLYESEQLPDSEDVLLCRLSVGDWSGFFLFLLLLNILLLYGCQLCQTCRPLAVPLL